MREQHDPSLAPKTRPDEVRGFLRKHPAGQILRRVQQRGRGRRHDGPNIGAGPNHLLQMARYRRRIDGRYDQCATLRIQKALDLLDHLYGIIVGFREPEFQSAVLRRQGQSAGDVLHELALIVLGKGEHGLKSRRDVAVWCSRIERWQHNRTRDPRWAIHRHRMAATYREQISDDERYRAERSSG